MKFTTPELKKLQRDLTDLAMEVAVNLEIKLDFSVDSIKELDKVFEEIHKDYKKTKNETGLHGLALEMAAYIVTVIEKNGVVGWWERGHKEMGNETFPYYITEDRVIFPYSWAIKRIVDGPKENIWDKFQDHVLAT